MPKKRSTAASLTVSTPNDEEEEKEEGRPNDYAVLPCLLKRRSIFPKDYEVKPASPVDSRIIDSLLTAARWGPFHGNCYKGCQHPARFVVLGKQSMVDMQHLTLRFYDEHWQDYPWGKPDTDGTLSQDPADAYATWRQQTFDEVTGRWGPED